MRKGVNKKRRIIKISVVVLVILAVLSATATICVGNYFINYALAPSGAGGERNVDREEVIPAAEDVESLEELIEKNRAAADESVDKWLESTPSEKVSIKARDGITLRAVKYPTLEESDKWVIVVHGYRQTPDKVLTVAENFHRRGYNVLAVSLRAHADSEGDYIGMGWLDRLDLLDWIDLLVSENPDAEIVLHGTSMGAAAVMMVSGEKLPENVKAIIEDCGYTSVWDIFSSELKLRFGLPAFPVMHMVDIVSRFKAGYSFREASALRQVKKSETPILFIHGDMDDFVPVGMVYELYEAADCEKDILVIRGASHTEAKFADPESYYEKVFSFIDKYTNQE